MIFKLTSKSIFLFVFLCFSTFAFSAQNEIEDPALNVERIKQGVIKSLPEATSIQNEAIRGKVYDAWVDYLIIKGKQQMEDLQASMEPDSPPLQDKTLADQIRSCARLAIAYTKDMDEYLPLFEVDMDRVVACALCYSLGEPAMERVLQTSMEVVRESGVGEIARYAHVNFWTIAEHEGLLEGSDKPPSVMADDEFIMWEESRVEVDHAVREGVIRSFPEAKQINNEENSKL